MTSLYKMFRSNSPDYDELRIKLSKALEEEKDQKAEERLHVNLKLLLYLNGDSLETYGGDWRNFKTLKKRRRNF